MLCLHAFAIIKLPAFIESTVAVAGVAITVVAFAIASAAAVEVVEWMRLKVGWLHH